MTRHTEAADIETGGKLTEKRSFALFLSLGGSLQKWHQEGILERELLYIRRYLGLGICDEVLIFTYGHEDTAFLRDRDRPGDAVGQITLLPPPRMMSPGGRLLFSLLGPIYHARSLSRASAFKTNQVSGSWSAIIAKWITRRRLVVRLGYVLSRRHMLNGKRLASRVSQMVEWLVFRNADAIVVTSNTAHSYAVKLAGTGANVQIVPTYVDTDLFRRRAPYQFDSPILYVGRLTPQKNLGSLIRAAARTGFEVHLVGEGESREELELLADTIGAKVKFLGAKENREVAQMMGEYTYFVLPSLHEGLPKVLIESMCAGMICIGTDIPGTNDLIEDRVTGYLAKDVSADALASALTTARSERNGEIGNLARNSVVERSGVDSYVNREKELIFPEFTQPV